MSEPKPGDLELQPHPVRRTARTLYAMAAVFGVAGLAQLGIGVAIPITASVVAAALAALGWRVALTGRAAQANNKAVNFLSMGRLDDAQTLLDRHAATIRRAGYARALDLQLATIAYRRGDLAAALTRCDAALGRRRSWLVRIHDDAHRDAATGLRAVTRAATGDVAGARRDIETLRAGDTVGVDALASAELAEALVLEREGATATLREHLARRRTLLAGTLRPRERALVRAIERKLDRERTTIYRTAAVRDEPRAQEPALADWMEALAPGTGAFAPRTARREGPLAVDAGAAVDPAALAAAKQAAKKSGAKKRGPGLRRIALWVLLIMMFLAIWQYLTPDAPPAPTRVPEVEPESPIFWTWALGALPVVFIVLFTGMIARAVIAGRRARREFVGALRAVALDEPGGPDRIAAVAASGQPVMAASAAHAVAELADKRGDFAGALAAAEAGLAKLSTPALEAATSDWVLPNLLAARAFAKLLLGRRDEALAEMALLAERFPSYPFLARASFRIQLVDRLRRGDVAGAAELAGTAEDIPISPREELLADVARAIADPATPETEWTRIQAELKRDAASARWILLAAPDALDAFAGARAGDAAEVARDVAAEAEALADAEAVADAAAAEARRARPER